MQICTITATPVFLRSFATYYIVNSVIYIFKNISNAEALLGSVLFSFRRPGCLRRAFGPAPGLDRSAGAQGWTAVAHPGNSGECVCVCVFVGLLDLTWLVVQLDFAIFVCVAARTGNSGCIYRACRLYRIRQVYTGCPSGIPDAAGGFTRGVWLARSACYLTVALRR